VRVDVAGVATVLGAPLITPAGLNDIPGGRVPTPTTVVHVYAPVPAVAASVRVQFAKAVHAASGDVVVTDGWVLIVSVKSLKPLSLKLSVAVTLTVYAPGITGVPDRNAVEGSIEIPGGKPVALQVNEPVPCDAEK
jgi:hypothetical protein